MFEFHALSADDQRRRGEELGADRYLVKSQVGIEDVVNTIHEVLGDRQTTTQTTVHTTTHQHQYPSITHQTFKKP